MERGVATGARVDVGAAVEGVVLLRAVVTGVVAALGVGPDGEARAVLHHILPHPRHLRVDLCVCETRLVLSLPNVCLGPVLVKASISRRNLNKNVISSHLLEHLCESVGGLEDRIRMRSFGA